MSPSKPQRIFEIVAVILTGLGKLILVNIYDLKTIYIFSAIFFWLGYVVFRVMKDKSILKYWGFRKENFGKTIKPIMQIGSFFMIAFFAYSIYKGYFRLHWHLLAILILYPAWGLVQQFVIMSLVGGNLKDSGFMNLSDKAIILFTALVFSLVHLPSILLTVATFFLALVYAYLFLKYRNLWPLGLFHGILGALFYFFVLNRNPWLEVFG